MADSQTQGTPDAAPALDGARQRTSRATEIGGERRRRSPGSLDRMAHLKLAITPEVAEANAGYHLHWVNDKANRMHSLTVQDDYEKVEGVEPVPVETGVDGKPIYAHLLRKRLNWYNADQREKGQATDDKERSLTRTAKTSDEDRRPDDVSYIPTGNRIGRG